MEHFPMYFDVFTSKENLRKMLDSYRKQKDAFILTISPLLPTYPLFYLKSGKIRGMFIPFEKKFNGSVNLDVVNLVDENDETGLLLMTDYRGPSLLLFSMFERVRVE